ncbi:2-amino-4-hydroxy-6-hydroxymethyldihydropteridine diphosphokinase [Lysobacter yangpyeongensis]|uniref:2-amino-4-hydroxy-6-hydroxymethyldihydropteridine pyrophosphokinase n=1 Tax=Lysobacter yangpyeongensis TaxID=346182 RepID=A0ABW0SI29_9GAMM
MSAATVALIGLGGNLGDAAATLRQAFQALDALPHTRLLRASRLYRSRAWGRTDQPDFINAVAMIETSLDARELLDAMLAIEHEAGRERSEDDRWGPRTLDLDLLLYGDAVIDEPGLHVPHPRLHERSFALVPLVEVAPDAMIPGIGSARAMLAAMEPTDVEALG